MNAIPAQLWLFLVKIRSYTQCLPKIAQRVKDNGSIRAICYFQIVTIEQGETEGKPAIGQFLPGSLLWLTNDRDTKREKIMSVCFGLLWSEKCKENHAWF